MTDEQPEPGVLESLPSTRPQRRSPKRDSAARAGARKTASAGRAATTPAGKVGPRARAPKAKAPRPAAPVATQGYESDRAPVEPPTRADIAATAVEAAGELAQIGLTLGEQLLRSIVKRLPKP